MQMYHKTLQYALLKEFKIHSNLKFDKWHAKIKTSPKPLLTWKLLGNLVENYHKSIDGDIASSRTELEVSIKK